MEDVKWMIGEIINTQFSMINSGHSIPSSYRHFEWSAT